MREFFIGLGTHLAAEFLRLAAGGLDLFCHYVAKQPFC
jgi:hypothetical protein